MIARGKWLAKQSTHNTPRSTATDDLMIQWTFLDCEATFPPSATPRTPGAKRPGSRDHPVIHPVFFNLFPISPIFSLCFCHSCHSCHYCPSAHLRMCVELCPRILIFKASNGFNGFCRRDILSISWCTAQGNIIHHGQKCTPKCSSAQQFRTLCNK